MSAGIVQECVRKGALAGMRCVIECCSCLVSESCLTLCDSRDCSLQGSSVHAWDIPGKNTGVGCHFLLQEIFLTWGVNPSSPALAGGFLTTEPPGKLAIGCSRSQFSEVGRADRLQRP